MRKFGRPIISGFIGYSAMEAFTYITLLFPLVLSVTGQHHRHVPMVTPTPYGAGSTQSSASISCYRPYSSVTLSFGRPFVIPLPGSTIQASATLPAGSSESESDKTVTQYLTTSNDATGLFYCESSYDDVTVRMYNIIHSIYRRFKPADGLVTKTINQGESVSLSVTRVNSGDSPVWYRIRNGTLDSSLPASSGATSISVPSSEAVHGDLYAVVASGAPLGDNHFSMIRLIVRGCAAGKWGPPDCAGVCDLCYNGGVCDDKTGDCICPPGFYDTNCLSACGMHRFGWYCTFRCGPGNVIQSCTGSQFGLPDPYGNSCISGYRGRDCNEVCSTGSFGAGCTQTCHCESGQCDAYTGQCTGSPSGCQAGWSGTNCLIPDMCPVGYYGDQCANKCYCQNNAACDQITGYCSGSNGVCATGYTCVTSSLACSAGFFGADCSRSCHCQNDAACDLTSHYCAGSDGACAKFFVPDPGTSNCLFGIVEFQAAGESNPGQNVELRCAGSSGQTLPASSITLSKTRDGSNTISYTSTTWADGVRTNTFSVAGIRHGDIMYCTLNYNGLQSTVLLHVDDFYGLPVLSQTPSVTVSSTSAIVNWQRWGSNDMDTGDGPVIAYVVYYSLTPTISWINAGTVTVVNPLQVVYSSTVQPLQPSTDYVFSVAAVREGPGGEGTKSPSTSARTLAEDALTPTTTISTTSGPQPTTSTMSSTAPTTSTPASTTAIPASTTSTSPSTAPTRKSTTLSTISTTSAPTTSTPSTPASTTASTTPIPESTTSSTESTTSSTSVPASIFASTESTKLMQSASSAKMTTPPTQPLTTEETNPQATPGGSSMTFLIPIIVSVVFVATAVAVVLGIYFLRRRRKQRLLAENQFGVEQELSTYENKICPNNNTKKSGYGEVRQDRPTSYEIVGVELSSPTYQDVGLPSWAQPWSIPWEDMIVGKKVLGRGNFGEVRDGAVMVGGEVPKAAIKTLKANASQNDRQNFMQEFRTLTKVGRHPNVVGILGACQHEDILYVALEFMPNGDLRTYLRNARSLRDDEQSTLSSEKLIQFAADVAKGMQYLVECGVIHRDLAARNILLDNQLVAKVSDFGLSRGENIYVQISRTEVPTRWLSLESLTSQTYTSKSDVWSFGILLWEIATLGATPYEDLKSHQVMAKLQGGYRMVKPSNCDDQIYNLMLMCWQDDPDKRPDFKKLVTRLTSMTDDQIHVQHTYLEILPRDEQYMPMGSPKLDGN